MRYYELVKFHIVNLVNIIVKNVDEILPKKSSIEMNTTLVYVGVV